MKKFSHVVSLIEKPQTWSDEYHIYALIRQEKVVLPEDTGEKVEGFVADYVQYTKEEWQDLVTGDLQRQTLNQLDQSLNTVKENKILESKALLEEYYMSNPLFSTVHNARGEYYSVTSDKQSYLTSMIILSEQSQEMGIPFTPTWNATGKPCEPWTISELKQLVMQIAKFVYPAVSKQQSYEMIIKNATSVEEVQNLEINYEDTTIS